MKYIISVLCPDKPGVVYNLSTAVCENKGNIIDMTQNVIRGFFTGVLYAIFDEEVNIEKLKGDINKDGTYTVDVVPYEKNPFVPKVQEKYILTLSGNEHKGIISGITDYLYKRNINIDSISATSDEKQFLIVASISLIGSKDALQIKKDIKALGEKWNITVHLSHENIFLATNTVCPTVRLEK